MSMLNHNFPHRHQAFRTCCDGRCTRPGGTCPAFAPGVIDGPHTRARRALAWRWVRRVGITLCAGGVLLGVFGVIPVPALGAVCVALGAAWAWGDRT